MKALNLSETVIRRIIHENKWERELPKKDYSFLTKELLQDLYINQKLSISNISKKVNAPTDVISNKLKSFGFNVRVRNSKGLSSNIPKIISLYNQGYLLQEIADKLHISLSYVSTLLKRNNIKVENRRKANISREELTELRRLGLSWDEIAKELNCKVSTLSDYLYKYKLISNPKTKIDLELLKQYCQEGKGIKEISKLFNCGRRTIQRQLSFLGLTICKDHLEHVTYEELYDKIINKRRLIKDVAKDYNISEATLKKKLKKLGISVIKAREEKVTKEILTELIVNQNLSQPQVAKRLGVGRSYIINKCKEYNVHAIDSYAILTKEFLIEHYVIQNKPACVISDEFNIPSSIIRHRIAKYHIEDLKTEEQRNECFLKSRDKALNNSRSKAEKEIQNIFYTDQVNVHNVIKLELDLYYPEQKVAIEYNGDYWHSTLFDRNSGLHLAKLSMCKNHGIQLINIFERDWNNKFLKDKIITLISRTLYPEKYIVPSGIIKRVFKGAQKKFEDQYNLNRYKETEYCVGIYSDKDLLSSISYSVKNDKCYIINFTTHKDYAENYEELLNFIKDKHNLPIIFTYDKRYYTKSILNTSLFTSYKEIKPKLYYVLNTKAKRIEDATEEYLNNPRCYPVYDCGFSQWIWK